MLIAIGAILVLGTTQIIGPALDSDGPGAGTARAAVLAAAVTLSFFTLEAGMHWILGDAAPDDGSRTIVHGVAVIAMVALFAVVIAFQLVSPARQQSRWRRHLALHLRNGLYANAAFDRVVGSLRIPASAGTPTP
jgi:NAD(P)H-quinone oxidoreductase subunit 5